MFLVRQAGPVENPAFKGDRHPGAKSPGRGGSDITDISHLFGNEGTIGEIL